MLRTAALAVAFVAITACTPEQLIVYEQATGHRLDHSVLELPDLPITLPDGRVVMADGIVVEPPADSRCPEHFAASIAAGWPAEDWSKLDQVIHRESACNAGLWTRWNRDDSYGLTQLNLMAHRRWVGPLVEWDFGRLFDPITNLRITRMLYEQAQVEYGCGWQPWRATASRSWCG